MRRGFSFFFPSSLELRQRLYSVYSSTGVKFCYCGCFSSLTLRENITFEDIILHGTSVPTVISLLGPESSLHSLQSSKIHVKLKTRIMGPHFLKWYFSIHLISCLFWIFFIHAAVKWLIYSTIRIPWNKITSIIGITSGSPQDFSCITKVCTGA